MGALICQECHSRHESAVFDILKQLGRVEGSPFREMCMVHQYPVERDSKQTGCGKSQPITTLVNHPGVSESPPNAQEKACLGFFVSSFTDWFSIDWPRANKVLLRGQI
jgi:hypothetical protein